MLIKGRKKPIVYPLLGTKEVNVKNLRSLIDIKFSMEPKTVTGISTNSTFKMGYSSNQIVLTKLKESSLDRCALHCACRQYCHSFSFVDDATQTICTLYKQSEKSDNSSASKLLYLKEWHFSTFHKIKLKYLINTTKIALIIWVLQLIESVCILLRPQYWSFEARVKIFFRFDFHTLSNRFSKMMPSFCRLI